MQSRMLWCDALWLMCGATLVRVANRSMFGLPHLHARCCKPRHRREIVVPPLAPCPHPLTLTLDWVRASVFLLAWGPELYKPCL